MPFLDRFLVIWNYPLVSLASGGVVSTKQVILTIVFVIFGILASRFAQRVLRSRLHISKFQPDVAHVIERVFFYTLLLLIFMTALGLLHVPLTAFAFVSGALAIGVGFGAQNIVNNFISGWILMSERPVRIGDFIEIGDSRGIVELIGTRSTRIRRVDGVHMLVPNSTMLEQTVVNWTLIDQKIRSSVRVGVAYGSPVRKVADLILQAVKSQEGVAVEPEPTVIFEDFGDNALVFDTFFWCEVSTDGRLRRMRSDIRFRLADLFADNDIVVAFPQRDVHFNTESPVPIQIMERQVSDSLSGGGVK